LFRRRWIRVDDVVGENHRERFVADQISRDQHRVPETKRFALANIGDVDHVGDLPNLGGKFAFAAGLEKGFQFDRDVEMVFDRVLTTSGDDDDLVGAGRHRFLDAVLNDRLVDQRQHFFWLRFGRRQKTRAEAGGGEDRFADSSHGEIVTYNDGLR
jgi:hypothetical protein